MGTGAARGLRREVPGGDVDRRLGRAVEVVQRGPAAACAGHCRPASVAAPRRCTTTRRRLRSAAGRRREEDRQHRRHEVQRRDPCAPISVDQVAGSGGRRGAATHQARPRSAAARRTPRPRRRSRTASSAARGRRRSAVGLLHPLQPVDDGAVLDHHALGRAGRARGVDDVGEVVRAERRRRASWSLRQRSPAASARRAQIGGCRSAGSQRSAGCSLSQQHGAPASASMKASRSAG